MTTNIFSNSATLTKFGFSALEINQENLSQYKLPKQIRDEIPTMNKFGYMKEEFDEFTFDFIEYASKSEDIVLELGTAYGWVVHNALKKGIKIIANDINHDHLAILLNRAPQEYLKNLYLFPAAFPDETDFPAETVAAVLSSRMFHFLDGEAVASGLDKIYKWLKPDGKLFLVSVTPHNYTLKETFLALPYFLGCSNQCKYGL
jgi:SAM-dependent methyltransferase